ncbi:MAG: toll/interleukin-1 receptor domain-containing protein [Alphaproteobacteria bacterium]
MFFSYAHEDEAMRNRLERALIMMKRTGEISTYHDRRITAGTPLDPAIAAGVERAEVMLVLVSPDFLHSDYCMDREMKRALERHGEGTLRVIPVILRACDWLHSPLRALTAIPHDGRPITLAPDLDVAFQKVTDEIRLAVNEINAKRDAANGRSSAAAEVEAQSPSEFRPSAGTAPSFASAGASASRSSNMRVAKKFTDADKAEYLDQAFVYLRKFFAASLIELAQRHSEVRQRFINVDATRFTATLYRTGRQVSQCQIYIEQRRDAAIRYSDSIELHANSFNESISVEADEDGLYLKAMGMGYSHADRERKLSFEGAAELLWERLIAPLQR